VINRPTNYLFSIRRLVYSH